MEGIKESCNDCHFFSLPFCVRKSSGILEGNHIKYDAPEYVADTFYCSHWKEKPSQIGE